MLRSLKTLFLVIALALISEGQKPDTYDTLFTRSNKMILVPRYDTVKQLTEINKKADTILSDLQAIKLQLGIKEEKDTIKTKIR